ncbi:hypothetical protein QBC40DRAFT_83701 [Triangularia verruculosa]|uniref:Uncharacterized protein n=1 Tax=Triangularia verruculosa TaxID=2587418 RepID=A0AAN7AZX8_9PEZI|nr:hypothetical protein QBC40DRAFT_83701 [Triangularia verruculosa]
MPHKVDKQRKMPSSNVVNGDSPHSATLRHLLTYPVVQDGVRTLKSTPVGSKAVEVSNGVYQAISQNVWPYVAGPYGYVAPYVERVDSVGDKTLEVIDEKFPVVKKQPGEIVEGTKQIIFSPLRISLSMRDYILAIYQSEVQKCGDSWTAYPKGLVVTALNLTIEGVTTARDYITNAKEQVKKAA